MDKTEIMNTILLDNLTDDDLDYLFKQKEAINMSLLAIKGTNKMYKKYDAKLGTKSPTSTLVQMNLPGIAKELYRKKDQNFTTIAEKICSRYNDSFLKSIQEIYGEDYDVKKIEQFTADDFNELLNKAEQLEETTIDLDLFWLQLRIVGIDVPELTQEIVTEKWVKSHGNGTDFSKEEPDEKEIETEETEPVVEATEEETKKKYTKSKNKLTPEQKEAKRREAEAKKKAAKKAEQEALKEAIQTVEEENTEEEESEEISDEVDIEDETFNISTAVKEVVEELSTKREARKMEELYPMHAYVGTVDVIYTENMDFYNFNPIGELNGHIFTPFTIDKIEETFPLSLYRNIMLFYDRRNPDHMEVLKQKLRDGMLLILEYEVDELEENRHTITNELNNTGYKVPLIDGIKERKIRPLWEDGFYSVRSGKSLGEDISKHNIIKIDDNTLLEGERFFLEMEPGFLAGPFEANYRNTLQSYVIETNVIAQNYLLHGYDKDSLERVSFERIFNIGKITSFRTSFFCISEDTKEVVRDYATDKILLETLASSLKDQGKDTIQVSELSSIAASLDENAFYGTSIPKEIGAKRFERVKQLLNDTTQESNSYDALLTAVSAILLHSNENERNNAIVNELFENEEFLNKIQNYKYIKERVEKLRLEAVDIQKQQKEANIRLEEEEKKKKAEAINSEELKEKDEAIADLKRKLEEYQQIKEDIESKESLEKAVEYYETRKQHLESALKELETSFMNMLNTSTTKMADITFDGYMSSKMLQSAAEWEEKEKKQNHEKLVEEMNHAVPSLLTGDDLVDYLVEKIQMERPHYSHNLIVNLFICSMQGMLTVFSGAPGCGKTSICNILAKVLGTNSFTELETSQEEKISRFIPVSVERGWTSKRDFVGYYNPLTKTFEESNHEVFDGLNILNTEARSGVNNYPFLILLDEANLSPMEYYWADFMNVCDDLVNNHTINLGNKNIFEIPETLHFVATINNDHTTETLSPRLIDRAWIITLPDADVSMETSILKEEDIERISWKALKETFVDYKPEDLNFDHDQQERYDELKAILKEEHLTLSARTELAIKRYCAVASKLMEEDEETAYSAGIYALDFAISQKVLPKIIGNGEEYEKWLTKLRDFAKKNYLLQSASILNRIIETGNKQMKFYQFF